LLELRVRILCEELVIQYWCVCAVETSTMRQTAAAPQKNKQYVALCTVQTVRQASHCTFLSILVLLAASAVSNLLLNALSPYCCFLQPAEL
jgi:hypothetical protein